MIDRATKSKSGKPGMYERKIVLLTDGQGLMDSEGLEDIALKIKQENVNLVVVLVKLPFARSLTG
jgi:ATP-dependent DNA helicase 2 subunit 2